MNLRACLMKSLEGFPIHRSQLELQIQWGLGELKKDYPIHQKRVGDVLSHRVE